MSGSDFIALRVGRKVPEECWVTGQRIACGECGAIFWVIGHRETDGPGVTDKQKEDLEIAIAAEHVDEKFADHLESYEFD